jgi:putative membrane protein
MRDRTDLAARSIIGRLESHNVAVLKSMRIRLLAWAVVGATAALAAALWIVAQK